MVVSEYEDMFPFSFGYEPWLILLHGRNKDKQELINPYNHRMEERKILQLEGKLCLGCFGEWLLLSENLTKRTYFLHFSLNPMLTVHLPSFGRGSLEYFCNCVVSDSPTSRSCMVTFVGRRSNCILYCRPNMDASWSKVSISIDSEGKNGFNGQVVRSKGKIYALHQCGGTLRVVVINESSLLNFDSTWTTIEVPDAIGSSWCHLVVSGGKVFLVSVALSSHRGNPINCTIYLLETDLSWKQVKSIGGRVFFLGGIQSAALSATLAGMQRDCIFIVNVKRILFPNEGIYRICLQDQTVSLNLSLKWPKGLAWHKLCWVMPTRCWKNNQRALSLSHSIGTNMGYSAYGHKEEKKEESCKIDNSRTWADMPIELVQLLLPRLYLVDCLCLTSLCKAWNSLSNLVQNAIIHPWLMYCVNESNSWRVFDPACGKEYNIGMKWLGFSEDLSFLYSKDGWVLASKEDNSLFLINPLTRECVSLPKLNVCCRQEPLAFSSAPTSPDCVVVVAEFIDENIVEISTWSPSEEQWSTMRFDDEFGYMPCNPVFSRGEFYWYRNRGELLVFNPFKKTRKVLEIEAPIEMVLHRSRVLECYLVDSGGDLITVFRGLTAEPIRIFKLDRLNMIWSELHDMGGVSIFLDRRVTIATSCLEERCHNRIYLSGFSDNHFKASAFYSLETSKYDPEICSDLKEPMNSIWLEPNLTA